VEVNRKSTDKLENAEGHFSTSAEKLEFDQKVLEQS